MVTIKTDKRYPVGDIRNNLSHNKLRESLSWDTCIEKYLDHLKALGMAHRTVKESYYPLNQFRSFCLGHEIHDINTVSEKDILEYAKDQLQSIKASTLSYKILLLKQFFGYLTKEKIISYDVSVNVRAPKAGKTLTRQIFTPADFVKLASVIDSTNIYGFMYRTIFELFYGTGIRMEELISLKLRDIDLPNGKVHLSSSKTLKERQLPLTEISIRYLDGYLHGVRPKILEFSGSSEDIVFLNLCGRSLNPRSINSRLKGYCEKASLDKVLTSHSFRFAYASHLYENKADIRHIYELLGHRSLSMTAKYIMLSKKALVEVLKKHHPRERGKL